MTHFGVGGEIGSRDMDVEESRETQKAWEADEEAERAEESLSVRLLLSRSLWRSVKNACLDNDLEAGVSRQQMERAVDCVLRAARPECDELMGWVFLYDAACKDRDLILQCGFGSVCLVCFLLSHKICDDDSFGSVDFAYNVGFRLPSEHKVFLQVESRVFECLLRENVDLNLTPEKLRGVLDGCAREGKPPDYDSETVTTSTRSFDVTIERQGRRKWISLMRDVARILPFT